MAGAASAGRRGRGAFARALVGATLAYVILDGIWIVWVAAPYFRAVLGDQLLEAPRILPAAAFYLLYPIGLTVLAVMPALRDGRLSQAILLGGTTGALAYGTFDLTNLALFKAYTPALALIDWTWGTIVSSIAAAAGFAAARGATR